MTSNAPEMLALLMTRLTGVHTGIQKANAQFATMAKLAAAAGAAYLGTKVVEGIWDTVKAAEKLNHELTKLRTGAQLNDAQTQAADALAFKIQQTVPGSNYAGNVKIQRELFGVFGDINEAQGLAPEVAAGSRAVSNYVDKDTDLAQIAVKAMEIGGRIGTDGKIDPAKFHTEFDAMVRAIIASEGLLKPEDFLAFMKQAGPAARNMSTDALWGMGPAIMNAMGSSRAGTAMMSMFQQMIGHVVAGKRVALAMEEAHMLTPGKWKTERGGKVVMDPDAVPDQAGFMANPMEWLHDHLNQMRQDKDKNGKPLDVLRIVQEIFQLSSRQTTARLINDIDSNWSVIAKEQQRFQNLGKDGIAGFNKTQNNEDLSVNVHNLKESWDAFMTALGKPGIPIAIGILHGLTDTINFMASVAAAHPTLAAWLEGIAAGLGAIAAVGGTAAAIGLTLRVVAGGLGAIGTALSATGFGSLVTVAAGLTSLGAGVAALVAPISAIMGILAIGSSHETPENRKRLEDLRKGMGGNQSPTNMVPQDGYGPDGLPIHKSSYIAPGGSAPAVQVHSSINIDGRKVADAVSTHQAYAMSLPANGSTRFDSRQSASYTNDVVRV